MQTNELPSSIQSSSNEQQQQQHDDDDDDDDPNNTNDPPPPLAAPTAITPPSYFTATTNEASQKQLATEMGYPSGWHVVRVVPHPADRFLYDMRHSNESKAFVRMVQGGDDGGWNGGESSNHGPQNVMMMGSEFRYTCPWSVEDGPVVDWMCSSYEDKIYSGVPGSGCDMYYNHEAAMQAALKWIPGTSTEFDDKGGHMLPREPLFKEEDFVEVFYEEENQWYYAKVTKVKEYLNDVRYTVFFPDEEATQDNISEENMRRTEKRSAKKKKKRSPKKDSSAKKSGGVALMELPMPGKKRKGPTSRLSAKEKKERSKIAKKMGLPEGWLALMGNNYSVRIWNPDGEFFSSKKKAFESIGLVESESSEEEMEQTGKRPRRAKAKKKDKRRHSRRSLCQDKKNYKETDLEVLNDPADLIPYSPPGQKNNIDEVDEEDPPWRRSGNALVGRTIEYSFRSENKRRTTAIGLITGWLDETDLDSEGNPAYIGEKSKKPEKLFHVEFDETAELLFIDLEEYEVLDMLVPEE